MNTSLLAVLKAWGIDQADQVIEPMISAQLLANPSESDQAITDNIVGFIKHNILRAKFGVIADFIMPFVEPTLRSEIATDIPIVKQNMVNASPSLVKAA